MTEQETFEIAVPIVRVVVDYIANKSYEKIPDVVGFSNGNSLQLIVTAINQFMDDAGITSMDTYDTPCKNGPDRYHEQLNVFVYSDGRGFAVDYFLATNGEINDLTLQMEFLVHELAGFCVCIIIQGFGYTAALNSISSKYL